jgi:hypothetical protein
MQEWTRAMPGKSTEMGMHGLCTNATQATHLAAQSAPIRQQGGRALRKLQSHGKLLRSQSVWSTLHGDRMQCAQTVLDCQLLAYLHKQHINDHFCSMS